MTALSKLDLYLVSLMRPAEHLRDLLRGHGVKNRDLKKAKETAKNAGLFDLRSTTGELVKEYFGPPRRANDAELYYDLSLWPEHEFQWSISEDGFASHDGFVLRQREYHPSLFLREVSSILQTLQVWRHTQREVSEILSNPDRADSWGESEEWHFRMDDSSCLVCDFDFALLRSFRTEEHAWDADGI